MSVYTTGIWQAKPGREAEFAAAGWELTRMNDFPDSFTPADRRPDRRQGPLPGRQRLRVRRAQGHQVIEFAVENGCPDSAQCPAPWATTQLRLHRAS